MGDALEFSPENSANTVLGQRGLSSVTEAKPHEFPWQVIVRVGLGKQNGGRNWRTNPSQNRKCSGSILESKRHILTSAHCVKQYGKVLTRKAIRVYSGVHSIKKDAGKKNEHIVSKVVIHRDQSLKRNQDLAIL